jgi:hypothetical protein
LINTSTIWVVSFKISIYVLLTQTAFSIVIQRFSSLPYKILFTLKLLLFHLEISSRISSAVVSNIFVADESSGAAPFFYFNT